MAQTKRKLEYRPSAEELLREARMAAEASYSPYSKFRVGAALLAGGRLYRGTNIENASYGLTVCAERTAIFAAIADGQKSFEAIAISCVDASPGGKSNSKFPCGACRQVLAEFAEAGAVVLIDGWGETDVETLLPLPFRLD
jgi:cytidine deaminase